MACINYNTEVVLPSCHQRTTIRPPLRYRNLNRVTPYLLSISSINSSRSSTHFIFSIISHTFSLFISWWIVFTTKLKLHYHCATKEPQSHHHHNIVTANRWSLSFFYHMVGVDSFHIIIPSPRCLSLWFPLSFEFYCN